MSFSFSERLTLSEFCVLKSLDLKFKLRFHACCTWMLNIIFSYMKFNCALNPHSPLPPSLLSFLLLLIPHSLFQSGPFMWLLFSYHFEVENSLGEAEVSSAFAYLDLAIWLSSLLQSKTKKCSVSYVKNLNIEFVWTIMLNNSWRSGISPLRSSVLKFASLPVQWAGSLKRTASLYGTSSKVQAW